MVLLRSEVDRVARRAGKPRNVAPSLGDMELYGRITSERVRGYVGGYAPSSEGGYLLIGWTETVQRLGFRSADRVRRASRDAVFADVRKVAERLGRYDVMPTVTDYHRLGRWTHPTVLRQLGVGSWREAAQKLGLWYHRHEHNGHPLREGI